MARRRSLFDRIGEYADDAAGAVRGRRLDREPFARLHFRGAEIAELERGTREYESVAYAASALLERTREE